MPRCSNLKSATLFLLQEYLKSGGRLILIGTKPHLVDGVETEISLEGALTTDSIEEAVNIVSGFFPDRIKVIDNLTGNNAPSVFVHTRKVNGSFRHLFVNTDQKREVRTVVEIPACRNLDTASFDLCDGNLYALPTEDGSFRVTLAPAGSLFVVCGEEAKEAKGEPPLFLGSGASFTDLPKVPPDIRLEEFDCEVMEENVLLLNNFTLELEGKEVYQGSVCGAWHTCFYPAQDGTLFKATYIFYSEVNLQNCFAVIEVAENLDSITFNGKELKPSKKSGELGAFNSRKSWKDINFTRVPIPEIEKGINTLVLQGKKVNNITGPNQHVRVDRWQEHRPTEAEEVYVCGRFSVKRCSTGRYVIAAFKKPSGRNFTNEGFPFYCGRAVLKASFNAGGAKGKIILRLNGVEAACAKVRLNGKDCGTLRWEPFVVDISKASRSGRNQLEIELVTTLVNAFGPNRRAGVKEENGVGPWSFIQTERFVEENQLFDFGLEGAAVYIVDL